MSSPCPDAMTHVPRPFSPSASSASSTGGASRCCPATASGTTGAFAVVFEGDYVPQGFLIPGIHRARRAARRLRGHLSAIGVEGDTVAVLCPRTNSIFAPRTVRGVRMVPPVLLSKEFSDRSRSAMPHQVQRAAESLIRSLAQSR
jgi:hypothetical protein